MSRQVPVKKQSFFSTVVEFAILLLIVFLIRTFIFGLYQVPSGSMETTMLVGERFFADKFTYLIRSPRRGEIIAFNAPEKFFKYSDNGAMRLFQHYVWGPDNLTKRVIGLPGDRVRGTIENGSPVIYINDKKLNEPYLNKYPLVRVFKENPEHIHAKIQAEVTRARERGQLDEAAFETILGRYVAGKQECRSYDPHAPFDRQPFYRMKSDCIERGLDGKPVLLNPGTPLSPMPGKEYPDIFEVTLSDSQYWLMGDNRLGSSDSRYFGPVDKSFIHGRIVFRLWSVDSEESWWIWDLIQHPIDFLCRMRFNRFFQVVR